MRHLFAAGSAIAWVLAAAGCGAIGLPSTESEPPLRIAVRQPSSLDPVLIKDATGVLAARQLFEPLVAFDPETLELKPALADRWKVFDGGSRFVFTLRPGAKFHNDAPVTTEDVRFSLNRLAAASTGSELAFLLDAVKGFQTPQESSSQTELEGIRVLDERNLEITLSAPWYQFPYVLTHPATAPVPRAAFEANPESFKLNPIGSGPYRLQSVAERGQDISLVRFQDHWSPDPEFESVQFLIYEDASSAWKDFESGLLDIAEAPPGRVAIAESKYGAAGFSPLAAGLYIGFNRAKLPDPAVRRAISLALDREAIAHSVYDNILQPGGGLISPGLPGTASRDCGRPCDHDPKEALKLLRGAFGAAEPPQVSLEYQSEGTQNQLAGIIEQNLATVGIKVVGRPMDLPGLYKSFADGGHTVFPLGWGPDYPLADGFFSPLFGSASRHNYTGLRDPEVDGLLATARAERDATKRAQLYRRLEKLLLGDGSFMPIGHFRNHHAAANRVEGFYVDRLGAFDINQFRLN